MKGRSVVLVSYSFGSDTTMALVFERIGSDRAVSILFLRV